VYGVALTVLACLRSGTRADVAWLVEAEGLTVADWSDAVVFTPGGGRIGGMAGGALDGQLADQAGRRDAGRLIDIEVSEIDALIARLPSSGSARCLLVPAERLPEGLWDLAIAREPICLVCTVQGDEVVDISLHTTGTVVDGGETVERLFAAGKSGSAVTGDQVVSVFRAVPQLVAVGDTDVAAALVELASRIGWNARVAADSGSATGMIAMLSGQDKVVVTAHELELAGAALMAALESDVGRNGCRRTGPTGSPTGGSRISPEYMGRPGSTSAPIHRERSRSRSSPRRSQKTPVITSFPTPSRGVHEGPPLHSTVDDRRRELPGRTG